jgi:hypothetical protein
VEHESHIDDFFDIEGFVHREFLRQGQTVNCWYYLEVLNIQEKMSREKDFHCGEKTPGSSSMTKRQFMHY